MSNLQDKNIEIISRQLAEDLAEAMNKPITSSTVDSIHDWTLNFLSTRFKNFSKNKIDITCSKDGDVITTKPKNLYTAVGLITGKLPVFEELPLTGEYEDKKTGIKVFFKDPDNYGFIPKKPVRYLKFTGIVIGLDNERLNNDITTRDFWN